MQPLEGHPFLSTLYTYQKAVLSERWLYVQELNNIKSADKGSVLHVPRIPLSFRQGNSFGKEYNNDML